MPAAYFLHWPDSELASLTEVAPAMLCLRLSAAACRRTDNGQEGYLHPLELLFEGATWRWDGPALGGIAHASLLLDGQPLGPAAHVLPLPLDRRGVVVCTLRLISGTVLQIDAVRVVGQIADAARFQASHAC
jgi:hypothetical protein